MRPLPAQVAHRLDTPYRGEVIVYVTEGHYAQAHHQRRTLRVEGGLVEAKAVVRCGDRRQHLCTWWEAA